MGEAHKAQVIGGTSDDERTGGVLWWLYSFITNEAAGVLQIASDGATAATYNGSSLATPSSAGFFQAAGAYLVVEPVSASESWQAKIRYVDSSTDDLTIEVSDLGGWQASDGTFGAYNTSGAVAWNDSLPPAATETLYMSAGDLDGYTYLRAFIYDGAIGANAFYVGGYVALDPANTKPVVLLTKTPEIANLGTATSWGNATGTQGRIPNEHGGSSSSWSGSYAMIDSVRTGTYATKGKTRTSIFVLFPVYVFSLDGFVQGYFGPNTLYAVDGAKADLDIDAAGAYIVTNDIAHRWVP